MTAPTSLYVLEESRTALLDTLELVEDDQAKIDILRDIAAADAAAIQKRNAVIRWRSSRLGMARAAREEAERLLAHATRLEKQVEHLDEYVLRVVEQFVPAPRKGPRKLECDFGTIKTRKCPDSCDITDEAQIPAEHKTLVLTLPAPAWETHVEWVRQTTGQDHPAVLEAVTRSEVKIDRAGIKATILAGGTVPGADIRVGANRLVVE